MDVSRLKPGAFEARAWITTADGPPRENLDEGSAAAIPQPVRLSKP